MALIILEGPRGVGKTTISQALHGAFMASLLSPVFKMNVWKRMRGTDPIQDQIDAIMNDFWPALTDPSHITIVDRFHTTEYVMTCCLERRDTGAALYDFVLIDRILYAVGAIGINLIANSSILESRIALRKDGRIFDGASLALWQEAMTHSYFRTIYNLLLSDTIKCITKIWAQSLRGETKAITKEEVWDMYQTRLRGE